MTKPLLIEVVITCPNCGRGIYYWFVNLNHKCPVCAFAIPDEEAKRLCQETRGREETSHAV